MSDLPKTCRDELEQRVEAAEKALSHSVTNYECHECRGRGCAVCAGSGLLLRSEAHDYFKRWPWCEAKWRNR